MEKNLQPRNKKKDMIISGFALFAIFFGAGNLIFPPYLGVQAGTSWLQAMLGFLASDPVIPIIGVLATVAMGGRADDMGKRVAPWFSKLLGTIAILIIGPLMAVPRTGATTHEIFVTQIFPGAPQWVTSLIFFALTLLIVLRPGKVIDIIGQFLTPVLLVILVVIVGVSIFNPPAAKAAPEITNIFPVAFREGYQTMDALGAALMAGIVITDLNNKGYHTLEEQKEISKGVGLVAFICLALVYGGLTYAGATVSSFYDGSSDRVTILLGMVQMLLGNAGGLILGLAVALACLTTSTGLISTGGNFFDSISDGKLSYNKVVVVFTIIAFLISLLGVDQIITFAVPILFAIFPIFIAVIFLSIFDKKIKYDLTYVGAVIGAGIIGFIQAFNLFSVMRGGTFLQAQADWTYSLPFANFAFEWLIPAAIGAVLFTLIAHFGHVGGTYEEHVARERVEGRHGEKKGEPVVTHEETVTETKDAVITEEKVVKETITDNETLTETDETIVIEPKDKKKK